VDCKQIVSEGVDWIHVAADRVKGRAVVNMEHNFGFLKCEQLSGY